MILCYGARDSFCFRLALIESGREGGKNRYRPGKWGKREMRKRIDEAVIKKDGRSKHNQCVQSVSHSIATPVLGNWQPP